MIFLDTSVLLRYLTGDDPEKAGHFKRFLQETAARKEILYVTHLSLAETIWVLIKSYQRSKTEVAEAIRWLLNTPNILCDSAPLILSALALFESGPFSFIDAYHAVLLPARGITEFCSYDTDFDQLAGAGITRREP